MKIGTLYLILHCILSQKRKNMEEFKIFLENDFENINTELDEFRNGLSIGIVGSGKLGLALISEFNKLSKLRWVIARSQDSKLNVINKIYNTQIIKSNINEVNAIPNFIILAISDSQIKDYAEELADFLGDKLNGTYIIHCSGFQNVDVLESLKNKGAKVGALHPFQTFYYESESLFKNVTWGIECDEEDYKEFSNLVLVTEGIPLRLPQEAIENKALYHAAAVVASNYITPVMQLANQIAKSINLKEDELLATIARTTINNNLKSFKGENVPLTGPIVRGDKKTIEIHINAMKGKPELLRPYCQFGLATAELAFRNELISEDDFYDIMSILKNGLIG